MIPSLHQMVDEITHLGSNVSSGVNDINIDYYGQIISIK